MRIFVGFDDTDNIHSDRGTGKLARWFRDKIPDGARLSSVIRQQLPILEGIPYTSKNSSACVVLESNTTDIIDPIIDAAIHHISEHFIEGSDPGLCVVTDHRSSLEKLVAFGRTCSTRVVTQKEAMAAADGFHLSGHGGTNDGIIGAAAGIGLTIHGWAGRFIDFNGLRQIPEIARVDELERLGIRVLPVERNVCLPCSNDIVATEGKLRPRLWGGQPAVLVRKKEGIWDVVGKKEQPHLRRIAG